MTRRKFIYSAALGLLAVGLTASAQVPGTAQWTAVHGWVRQAQEVTPVSVEIKSLGANDNATYYLGADLAVDIYGVAGKWIPSQSFTLTGLAFKIYREGTSGLNVYTASVFAGNGTSPTTEIAASATSYSHDTLNASPAQYVEFTFTPMQLTGGTEYWLTIWSDAISATKVVDVRFDNTGAENLIVLKSATSKASPTWSTGDADADLTVKVYGY